MRNLDILVAESGEHVRVLLCREEQSYVVSCQHFRMPYPVASDLLAELQPVPAETYTRFFLAKGFGKWFTCPRKYTISSNTRSITAVVPYR